MATRACHLTAVQCGAAEPPHSVTSLCNSLVAYILELPWTHQRHLEVSGMVPWASVFGVCQGIPYHEESGAAMADWLNLLPLQTRMSIKDGIFTIKLLHDTID